MNFKHTKRCGFMLTLLNILTLSIASIFINAPIAKEVNSIDKDHHYKKTMNFVGIWFLGFITVGIVPMIWYARLGRKVGGLAKEHGIEKPSTSFAFTFLWLLLGSLIVVGPFVALTRIYRVLNALEKQCNKEAREALEEEIKAAEAPVEEAKPEEIEEVAAPVEAVDATAEAVKTEVESIESAEVDASETETFAPVAVEEKPTAPVTPKKRWKVRFEDGSGVKYFDTKEEAISYAKGLAKRKRVKVRVKAKAK